MRNAHSFGYLSSQSLMDLPSEWKRQRKETDLGVRKDEVFLEVHKIMLRGHQRTFSYSYRKAILGSKNYFKDKVVMDVGCGPGVLSIFCAQAGAKKVYAVEASHIANLAKEIVKENRFEHVVEVIHSAIEDLVLPGNVKVDAIVSKWMGFYLLHEGMLDSVLVARDKFLKEDGQIFPQSAALLVAPCSVPTLNDMWENVQGVSMTCVAAHFRRNRYLKPQIMVVQEEDLLAVPEVFCSIDLKEVKTSDLEHLSLRHVSAATKAGRYQGMCLWFECYFPELSEEREEPRISLSTSPDKPMTHWKQTVLLLPQEQEVKNGEPIAFQLNMTRNTENKRNYTLNLELLDPNVMEHPLLCSCFMSKCIQNKTLMQDNSSKENGTKNILEEDNVEEKN